MDDNLKRIVSEILRLCREQGKQVEVNVAAYMVCLSEAQGAWENAAPGATLADKMDAKAVAAIAQLLVPQLTSANDPLLATAKMQVMMEAIFKQQREIVEREQGERQERVDMLERAVTGPRNLRGNHNEAYEKFYKVVMEYVCVMGGMELALQDETAGAEVRAALESVFPVSTVARFLTLSEGEKAQQVQELSRIVTGICLYNRTINRGGSALPAAAATYLPQANRLLRDINRHVADLEEEVTKYGALLVSTSAHAAAAAEGEGDAAAASPPPPPSPTKGPAPDHDRVAAELLNKAQSLSLFDSLQRDMREGLSATQALNAELDHLMLMAVDTVGSAAAVSKEAIYPIFERAGAIHDALHQELRMLVVRQRLYDELVYLQGGYVSSLAPAPPSRVGAGVSTGAGTGPDGDDASAAEAQALSEQMSEATLDAIVSSLPEGVEYVPHAGAGGVSSSGQPSSSGGPDVALAGFCPVSLGSRGGVLARGRPALGGLRLNGKTYYFAGREAMQAFAADPNKALSGVAIAISKQPLLVRLLGAETSKGGAHLDLHALLGVMSGPLKVDFGAQTPVHFVEKHIDPNYEWNVWALRRRALALANLRLKATHSTQTGASHFRRDADTQVWRPKEAQVQTRVNKGQAMPKKLQYVAGLRGAPDVKMNVVRLELDLGQPHQH